MLESKLRKPEVTPGVEVRLGNGELWLIPELAFMPRSIVFGETPDGVKPIGFRPTEQAQRLSDCIGSIFDALAAATDTNAGHANIDLAVASEAAYLLLAVNYNITPDVVSAAGLINESVLLPMLMAAMGQKKKAASAAQS